jgi:hypothetical protein
MMGRQTVVQSQLFYEERIPVATFCDGSTQS